MLILNRIYVFVFVLDSRNDGYEVSIEKKIQIDV